MILTQIAESNLSKIVVEGPNPFARSKTPEPSIVRYSRRDYACAKRGRRRRLAMKSSNRARSYGELLPP